MLPLRHALLRLSKSPLSSVIAVATLALAIGVNTAVFSILDGFLLRTLPYQNPEQVAALVVHREAIDPAQGRSPSEEDDSFDADAWRQFNRSLTSVALASWGSTGGANLAVAGAARYVADSRVSAGYFDVLGAPLYLGREFTAEEDRPNGPAVAILSYSLWQSAFQSDARILGRTIQLKGEPHTIVGILARNAVTPSGAAVFTPLRPAAPNGECGGENCGILVRLKPGATWAQANTQLAGTRLSYFTELETRYHTRARIYARPLQLELAGDMRENSIALMAAVGFILLIACGNLAGLALVRLLRREREISTRFALGASRLSVLADLWAEDLVIALLGGLGGVGLALVLLPAFRKLLPAPVGGYSIDLGVLLFTLGVSFGASVLCGALPALHVRRFEYGSRAFGGSRPVTAGSRRLHQMLIGAQVALTVVLLVSAGLMVRTLVHLETLPPGFDSHNVMTATASLDDARYHDAATFRKLLDQSVAAMRQIPGVREAAVGLSVPYERGLNDLVSIPDGKKAGTKRGSSLGYVTPAYFSALGMPVLAGRSLVAGDSSNSERVAIVNQAFGRRFFDDPAPIGYHLATEGATYIIVGVVGDVAKQQGIQRTAPLGTEPVAYLPASQTPQALVNIAHIWFQPSWIVRTSGPIRGLTVSMQRALEAADPNLPFSGFRSMDQILAEQLRVQRIEVLLLATLAGLALLLSAVGIYGMVSNLVTQRTREIGIRMALGSTVAQVVVQVGSAGALAAAGGLLTGLALALLATRVLASQIYGVSTHDAATFIAIPLILALAAGAASFLPALRISRIQPAETLRAE